MSVTYYASVHQNPPIKQLVSILPSPVNPLTPKANLPQLGIEYVITNQIGRKIFGRQVDDIYMTELLLFLLMTKFIRNHKRLWLFVEYYRTLKKGTSFLKAIKLGIKEDFEKYYTLTAI